jgi:hypothetical protein
MSFPIPICTAGIELLHPARKPISILDPLQILLWSIGIILVVGLILWLVQRWRKKRQIARLPVPLTPYELTLNELEALKAHLREGTDTEFSYRISEILRGYCENILNIHSLEMTSEEFLVHLLQHPPTPDFPLIPFGEFINRCDLVKYARAPLKIEERQTHWNFARQTVEDLNNTAAQPDHAVSI